MKKLLIILLLISVGFAAWITPTEIASHSDEIAPMINTDSSGNVFIVYNDAGGGNFDVFFIKSSDGGATWSSVLNLSNSSDEARYPFLLVDGSDNLYVFWYEGGARTDVVMKKSTDGGDSWGSPVNVSSSMPDSTYGYAYAAVDSSDVIHVVFGGGPFGSRLYYVNSSDGGSTWGNGVEIADITGSEYAKIAIDSNDYIHVVKPNAGIGAIGYLNSTDNGANWGSTINLLSGANSANGASIAFANGSLYAAYVGVIGGFGSANVYVNKSTDYGSTWSQGVNVSGAPGYVDTAFILSDSSGKLHLMYINSDGSDYSNLTYINSNDGVTWSSPSVINDNFTTYNYYYYSKNLANYGENIFAVWDIWNAPAWNDVRSQFNFLFSSPRKAGFSVTELDGSAFDESSTSLTLNNSAINVTWQGLTSSEVYPLSGKSLTASFVSDTTSATISVNDTPLNNPANITITGLSGIDSINSTKIIHGSDTVFFNGSLTAANGGDDLAVVPTLSGGNLTLQVLGFSDWIVLEDAIYPQIENASVNKTSTVTVTIDWDTNVSSNSTINYGETESFGSSATNTTMTEDHFISLDGLTTSQTYYYQIISCTTEGNCNTSSTSSFTALHQSEGETVVISAPGLDFVWVLMLFIFAIALFVIVKK